MNSSTTVFYLSLFSLEDEGPTFFPFEGTGPTFFPFKCAGPTFFRFEGVGETFLTVEGAGVTFFLADVRVTFFLPTDAFLVKGVFSSTTVFVSTQVSAFFTLVTVVLFSEAGENSLFKMFFSSRKAAS